MSKADACTSRCSVASINALLKRRDTIFLDNIVALIIKTTANLVVLACGIVECTAID